MKTFNVRYLDTFRGKTEEECYDRLLDYLWECVTYKDVTAFEFTEQKKRRGRKCKKNN